MAYPVYQTGAQNLPMAQPTQSFFQNPLFGMGAGLLSGAMSGRPGAGLQTGFQNLMQTQRANESTAMLGMRIQEMKRQREEEAQKRRTLAEIYTNPDAAKAAQVGQMDLANQLQFPQPSKFDERVRAVGLEPGTPEAAQFLRDWMLKPETQINMGERPEMGEARSIASTEASISALDELEKASMGKEISPTRAAVLQATDVPVIGEAISAMDPMTDNEAKQVQLSEMISGQVTAAMRGAQVGPAEQARIDRQLPRPGQPAKQFQQNLKATRKNLEDLNSRVIELRQLKTGGQAKPDSTSAIADVDADQATLEDLLAEQARRSRAQAQ